MIVQYKCYIFAFKAFHSVLLISLNLNFKLKYRPYGMRSTNNYRSKPTIGLFSAINVSINLWSNLHNQVGSIDCYALYKTYILNLRLQICICRISFMLIIIFMNAFVHAFCKYIYCCLSKYIHSYVFNLSLVTFRSYNSTSITLCFLYSVTFCICNLIVTLLF